jgi:hypothetical protein
MRAISKYMFPKVPKVLNGGGYALWAHWNGLKPVLMPWKCVANKNTLESLASSTIDDRKDEAEFQQSERTEQTSLTTRRFMLRGSLLILIWAMLIPRLA